MKFTLLALTVFSILPQYVSPVLAANDVCSTGIYATLAPLAAYAPARAYCSAKFPAVVVTVTASVYVRRGKRNPVPVTTSNDNAKKSSTTTKKPPTTTTTTKATRTTNTQDSKSSLLSLLSAQAYNIASTFCSCIIPPKTVTITTTSTTTPAAPQCTTTLDIPDLGDCSDCNTSNCANTATCVQEPYGGSSTTLCRDIQF